MKEIILALFNDKNFDELQKFVESCETEDLVKALSQIDRDVLVQLFPLLPEDISAECFIKFETDLQKYLVENVSEMNFKDISEEILETEGVEDIIESEVFNEVILQAEADTRHEKLLEIIEDLNNKKFSSLKPILKEMDPVDISDILNDIDKDKLALLFRILPKDIAAEVFVNMENKSQEFLIEAFTNKELSNIINDLFADDVADIVEEMPSNVVRKIMKAASNQTRSDVNKLLGFPKDSAGSIMTPECITLRPQMTVEEALHKIRKQAIDKETIYTCYVTDDNKKLLGIVTAKDIILHKPTDIIGDFMSENFIMAHTHTDKEEVSNLLSKYDLLAIPIVDSEDRINGIVTIDDAIDVIQEETSEDISKMAAIVPTHKPYLQTSVFNIFKSRFPWLLILLVSATVTGLIINSYEGTLNALSPLLFACIPMLMDSGGNAGSQASVTIIRSLALNELEFKNVFRVIWKEIRVALLLALMLSIACFAKLQLIDKLIFGYNYTIKISLVVSIALFVTIAVAKIVGACLPLLAKKCKLDPAVVASPFITTIVDAISLILYCQIAVLMLT